MARFLCVTTGPGEYAGIKSFMKFVQKKGHEAMLLASDNIVPILKAESDREIDVDVFSANEQDFVGRLNVVCDFYDIDVLVMKPSRGLLVSIPKPANIKVAVTLEDNLQFMGVGGSYRLDTVLPEWLDIYAVVWPPEVYERALFHHYGVHALAGYKDLENKVRAVGWIPSQQIEREQNQPPYAFSYFGSGSNFNEGILPVFVKAFFETSPSMELLSVSQDVVTGNYDKLTVMPIIKDYDKAIMNASEVYLHEGYGSICKCMSNNIPVMSFCSKQEIKQMEIQALEDLGLIYKYNRPTLAEEIDSKELVKHIEAFRDKHTEIKKNQEKMYVDGCARLYNLIMEKL